jgi:hypothetical protein
MTKEMEHIPTKLASAATALALVGCAVVEKASPTQNPDGSSTKPIITEVAPPENRLASDISAALKPWKNFSTGGKQYEMFGQIRIPLRSENSQDILYVNAANPDGSPNLQVEYTIVNTTLRSGAEVYQLPFLIKNDKTVNTQTAYILSFSKGDGTKDIYDMGELDSSHNATLSPFQFVIDYSAEIPSFRLVKTDTQTEEKLVSAQPTEASQIADIAFRAPGEQAPFNLTPTPDSLTATPEIKQYKICTVENYEECPVPVEDLYNGDYLTWLKTLSKPFDPSVKNSPLMGGGLPLLMVSPKTEEEYQKNPSSNSFRKGPAGSVTTENGIPGIILNWEGHSDLTPNENAWLVTAMFKDPRMSDAMWQEILDLWISSDTPVIEDYSNIELDKLVPLWREAYDRYPTMKSRTRSYRERGDPSYLSAPGIILPATVIK